jgi:hypothetical protein
MATPDEVRASLLASGDHGRDGCARRKLAERVKTAILVGSAPVVVAAHEDRPEDAAAATVEMATAASAVVLASGLRAPANGSEPTTIIYNEASALTEAQWRDAILAVEGQPPPDGHLAFGVSPNRQGWRARLANVERLLAASLDSKTPRQTAETVADALAEIRAMIDGDGE